MFTGIIQALGSVEAVQSHDGDRCLVIQTAGLESDKQQLGESIAVNGVCLTVTAYTRQGFAVDVSSETLNKTNLGQLKPGSPVNLERALTLNTVLGGHLVSGHVDGLATITAINREARSIRYCFEVEARLKHYLAEKGSVTIDGTSLTVNRVDQNQFDVNIVPHTQTKTIFGDYQVNTQVNLEVDMIARYLERLIGGRAEREVF